MIGETAVIGRKVRIYQAVTLGAKRFEQDAQGHLQKGLPRHPVVEDGVVIYAGATILGRVTLGAGAVIGGNVWLTQDVPPGASVTQASLQAQAVSQAERRVRLAAEVAL
ncbi:Serine acetyltransferase [compost metagenome]